MMPDKFIAGVACALASMNRMHYCPTQVVNVLDGFGLSYQDFVAGKVDEYDLREIRRCLEQGGPAHRAQVAKREGLTV